MNLGGYEVHGQCLLWDWRIIIPYITANLDVAICYWTLPWLFYRMRKQIPVTLHAARFSYSCLIIFILSCGITHLMDVVVLFVASYWLQVAVLLVTGVASTATVWYLRDLRIVSD
jgi:hypothetical protein